MTNNTAWLFVFLSGLVEILFAVTLKLSDGFSKPLMGIVSITAGLLSVWLMSLTLKVLPLSVVYIVWSGIGALGTVLIGMFWLKEPINAASLLCMAAIVIGTIGLQMQGKG